MLMEVKLRYLRESRNPRLSLNDMARLTGLSPQQIQRLEAGDSWFSRDSLVKICEALNCKPGDLLELVPDKKLKLDKKFVEISYPKF